MKRPYRSWTDDPGKVVVVFAFIIIPITVSLCAAILYAFGAFR